MDVCDPTADGYRYTLMIADYFSRLPQDVSTAELHTNREQDIAPHPFATWVRDALEVAYDHVRESLRRTMARRKRLYDTKAVNRCGAIYIYIYISQTWGTRVGLWASKNV